MRTRPQSRQSKLTSPRTFKVRPAADGFYVVDCHAPGPGKVVAWFAGSEEAVREAHARRSAEQEHAQNEGQHAHTHTDVTPRRVDVPPDACCRTCLRPATWALRQWSSVTVSRDKEVQVTWVTDSSCSEHGPAEQR